MDLPYILQTIYILIVLGVSLRVIYDTQNASKTLGYLMLIFILPIAGIIVYFMFGVNYRKHKMYQDKNLNDKMFLKKISDEIKENSNINADNAGLQPSCQKKQVNLIYNEINSPLSDDNKVSLLINGEEKFPELYKTLKAAKKHIHIEYYIYEDDEIGRSIEEILKEKAKEGVKVKLIYDDLGSRSIRREMVPRLKEAGVEIAPFYEIKWMLLANRINYRNHRKIIVVDGHTAFVGGINVGNDYVNDSKNKKKQFWRDSHLKLCGSSVYYLQYLFMSDWNHCVEEDLEFTKDLTYFPEIPADISGDKLVQIACSGPDSNFPTIKHSVIQAINLAEKEILLTTPYFVPGESVMDALCIAAKSGIKVVVLVPDKSDSFLVDAASEFYYEQLLTAGAEIYLYTKGFIHSKSLVIDNSITILGTANMDIRSFDLNFEVNAVVYDLELGLKMKAVFEDDISNAEKIDTERWKDRSVLLQLKQKIARLFSPIL